MNPLALSNLVLKSDTISSVQVMFILARGFGQDTFTAGLNQEKIKQDVLTRGLKLENIQYKLVIHKRL